MCYFPLDFQKKNGYLLYFPLTGYLNYFPFLAHALFSVKFSKKNGYLLYFPLDGFSENDKKKKNVEILQLLVPFLCKNAFLNTGRTDIRAIFRRMHL